MDDLQSWLHGRIETHKQQEFIMRVFSMILFGVALVFLASGIGSWFIDWMEFDSVYLVIFTFLGVLSGAQSRLHKYAREELNVLHGVILQTKSASAQV